MNRRQRRFFDRLYVGDMVSEPVAFIQEMAPLWLVLLRSASRLATKLRESHLPFSRSFSDGVSAMTGPLPCQPASQDDREHDD